MATTGQQVKAARGALGWSLIKLAIASNVGSGLIESFESGLSVPRGAVVERLARILEAAGAEFEDGAPPPAEALAEPAASSESRIG